jgi:hypothetical protein
MKGAKSVIGIIVFVLIIARIGIRISRLSEPKPRYERLETVFDHAPQENIQINEFTNTTAKISKITGWYLNPNTGKWVSKPNRIAGSETDEEMSLNWLRVATFVRNTNLYYALLYESNESPYNDAGNTGASEYTSTSYIVLNTSQYEELVNSVNNPSDSATVIRYQKQGQVFSYEETKDHDVVNAQLLTSISSSFNNPYPTAQDVKEMTSGSGKKNMVIKTEKVKGKMMVKFSLSGSKNLDNSYFEISKSEFKKLFIE